MLAATTKKDDNNGVRHWTTKTPFASTKLSGNGISGSVYRR